MFLLCHKTPFIAMKLYSQVCKVNVRNCRWKPRDSSRLSTLCVASRPRAMQVDSQPDRDNWCDILQYCTNRVRVDNASAPAHDARLRRYCNNRPSLRSRLQYLDYLLVRHHRPIRCSITPQSDLQRWAMKEPLLPAELR